MNVLKINFFFVYIVVRIQIFICIYLKYLFLCYNIQTALCIMLKKYLNNVTNNLKCKIKFNFYKKHDVK